MLRLLSYKQRTSCSNDKKQFVLFVEHDPLIDATGLRPAEFICSNYLYSELTDRRFPRRKLVESHIRFIDQSDPR